MTLKELREEMSQMLAVMEMSAEERYYYLCESELVRYASHLEHDILYQFRIN